MGKLEDERRILDSGVNSKNKNLKRKSSESYQRNILESDRSLDLATHSSNQVEYKDPLKEINACNNVKKTCFSDVKMEKSSAEINENNKSISSVPESTVISTKNKKHSHVSERNEVKAL